MMLGVSEYCVERDCYLEARSTLNNADEICGAIVYSNTLLKVLYRGVRIILTTAIELRVGMVFAKPDVPIHAD